MLMLWITPKSQDKVVFEVSSPQLIWPLKKHFLLVPLISATFWSSFTSRYFLTLQNYCSSPYLPCEAPKTLICLVHLPRTFSFFHRWNIQIFSLAVFISPGILDPHRSFLLMWRLSKCCSLKCLWPKAKALVPCLAFLQQNTANETTCERKI